MRLGLSGAAAVVLFVVVSACGPSSSAPDARGNRDVSGDSSQGPSGGSTGGGAANPCVPLRNDPLNCGTCGFVCSFANATPLCSQGVCVRGACARGWYDLDGDPASGCEARCSGQTCTIGSGPTARTVTLSALPVPESGAVASAFTSGGPVVAGDHEPRVAPPGLLGEATPLPYHDCDVDDPAAAYVENQNQHFVNQVGYQAVLR